MKSAANDNRGSARGQRPIFVRDASDLIKVSLALDLSIGTLLDHGLVVLSPDAAADARALDDVEATADLRVMLSRGGEFLATVDAEQFPEFDGGS